MEYKYRIAIPSYKRAQTLKNSTLKLLQKYKFDPSLIDIFVANEEQWAEYSETLEPGTYSKLILGEPGVMQIRNVITDYYERDALVFSLDDDLWAVNGLVISKKNFEDEEEFKSLVEKYRAVDGYVGKTLYIEAKEVPDFKGYIQQGFEMLDRFGAFKFGFSATPNPISFSFDIKGGLYYIIGYADGFVNKPHLRATMHDKEDYERSIKYFLEAGKVIQIPRIGFRTGCYTEPGGMQETRTPERVEQSAKLLASQYPDLCKPYEKVWKKGPEGEMKRWEVRFTTKHNKVLIKNHPLPPAAAKAFKEDIELL